MPGLQACLRRTAHSAKVWCTAMTAVESLIAERWDTQKLLCAISQQSSLQNVATWAEFQQETRDKLAQIWQVKCPRKEDRAARDCAACLCFTSIILSLKQGSRQDSLEHEVYCRMLPPLSLCFAGAEFKSRVS